MQTFIPVLLVHHGDWVMAAFLTFFLATNSLRMVWFVLDGQKVPWPVFISEFKVLLVQAATQKNWRQCDQSTRWLKHFILVTGYVIMFTLVMFFLPLLQVDTSRFTWVSLLGYYATFAIVYYSGDALWSRLRKRGDAQVLP